MEWIIIDLETTGLNAKKDKIIEIGAVLLKENGERKTFQTLIDPEMSLSFRISELTGITDEMLIGQPTMDEIIDDFLDFMGEAIPVAHNAAFDGAFLEPFVGHPKDAWLDTITLCKMVFPMLESYSLANLVEYFGIETPTHHRAMADAIATTDLFLMIENSMSLMDKGILGAWIHLFGDRHKNYQRFISRFEPDLFAESYLPPKASHSKENERKNDEEESEKYVIDRRELTEYFEGEHGLKKFVAEYRPRSSQVKMSQAVCDAFNNEHYLLAEAGTGTGKTIAYLMPSALFSLNNKEPVIISTHTIHLQDQIMRKDIPELNRLFGGRIRSALIKGRNHYLCYRKWEYEYRHGNGENAFFMAHLLPWVCETTDGDGDILNLNAFEKHLWQQFSASTENCLGPRCPYYHGKCFVRRARREAEQAHLIVVNHSLLLTDSVMCGGILPQCDNLVIDEAHQLETVAESCLGNSLSFHEHTGAVSEISSVLQKLYRRISAVGLYVTEQKMEQIREKQEFLEEFLENLNENGGKGKDAFYAVRSALNEDMARNMNSRSLRIDCRIRESSLWTEAGVLLENLLLWYEEIRNLLNKTAVYFEQELEEDGYENDKIRFSLVKCHWQEHCDALVAFLGGEEKNNVAWIEEGNERTMYPVLKTAPLLIDNALAKALYQLKKSIVFVSATLSVNGNFHYFRNTCGLDLIERAVEEMILPSPFDYDHQSVLLAATDVPLVGTVTEFEYLDRISDAIISMTAASKGRALVLFTSHVHLREVFRRIEVPLREKGVTVLAHEISGARNTLLKRMREDSHTVILGANSFWEGIDVAGENLSLLIIVRLPFWPPDIPTIAAKTDRLKAEGRNSFGELSLPQAIIRFKQGFGRLLRKEDDRGVICVLDKRIYEKRYGNDFVDSLPVSRLYRRTVKDISYLLETRL